MKELRLKNIFPLATIILGLFSLLSTIIIYFYRPFVWTWTEESVGYKDFENNPLVYYMATLTILLFLISYILNRIKKIKFYKTTLLFGTIILMFFISFSIYRLKSLTREEQGNIVYSRP
jgi:hypothetical protein